MPVQITENWTPIKCSSKFEGTPILEVPKPFFNCSWLDGTISLLLPTPAHGKTCPHDENSDPLECNCFEVQLHTLDLEGGKCTDIEGQRYHFPSFNRKEAEDLLLMSKRRSIGQGVTITSKTLRPVGQRSHRCQKTVSNDQQESKDHSSVSTSESKDHSSDNDLFL